MDDNLMEISKLLEQMKSNMLRLTENGMVGDTEEVMKVRNLAKSTGTTSIFGQLFPEYLKKFGDMKDLSGQKIAHEFKNNREAVTMREKGNRYFSQEGNEAMKKSLECYTTSVANAAPGSLELALAFANRSALLLKLNCPEDSLKDIERALQGSYPENLRPKLYYRRGECYAQLATENHAKAKSWLGKMSSSDGQRREIQKTLKHCSTLNKTDNIFDEEAKLPELKSLNSSYPCASDAVKISYSKVFGKQIVATRDIKPGEILVIEKPYAKVLNNEKIYTHCTNCLKFVWAPIPCYKCVNAVYCSEDCRSIGWEKYHQFECPLFEAVRSAGDNLTGGLAVKVLLQMNHEAGGLQKLKARVKKLEDSLGLSESKVGDKWYQTSTLESILSLLTHADKYEPFRFRDIYSSIAHVLFILATDTDFFGIRYKRTDIDKAAMTGMMSLDPDVIFVGGLLVKIAFVLLTNAYQFSEEDSGYLNSRGTVIMPFLSLVNHSCAPNTCRQFKRHHIVLHATGTIKKGEQVFDTYGPFYHTLGKYERQESLQSRYFFECSCIACRENWATLTDLESIEKRFKSSSMMRKIAKPYSFLENISEKVCRRDYRDKDKMLKNLYNMSEAIMEGAHLPCKELCLINQTIFQILFVSGNTSKFQAVPPTC